MQHPNEDTSRQVTIPRVNNRPVETKQSAYDESEGFTKHRSLSTFPGKE
jgi:hypothetical protein